ncbi:autotransporter outer membrane beta-barrel domain-containing protein, partial [Succinatimonas hippei]|uniref:autotransporter outer membrane beta-barrel domain-containing protein n=1 Tax=Succinatimonas hippei TaxID=626938 RepID=UPI0026F1835B
TVDKFFESSGKPGEAITAPATKTLSLAAVNVLVADSEATVLAEEETAAPAEESGLDEVTNFKLVGVESTEISDAGKTIVDMSRANYANAVYMDTLNKRQGEARFVGDTDHGVWVRLRHDNIGKDDSFRTHDTMVEVGFDQRDIVDSGEFHTGFALDYMNGQIDYHTVDGDGDIERYGIWFYTTYLGNDGQYADLVLKYGHLKNDFDFNLDMTGVNVNGDYTNEVASISAEYGWKFSNSYNYYIEPQAQLQYSYVTGADYSTSYGTKVDLDSIHSLIGRIGFRAGKDFNTDTPITAYIRGDVLHEFLGDQDIYAYDNTGVMDVTYENDDTWYTVGLGMTVKSSDNTYFFIEGETALGADNDNTYTVSGGFKHSF